MPVDDLSNPPPDNLSAIPFDQMSRRDFIKGAAAVATASVLLPEFVNPEIADAAAPQPHLPERSDNPHERALIAAGYWDIPSYQQVIGIPVGKQINKIGPLTRSAIDKKLGLHFDTVFPGRSVVVQLSNQTLAYFENGSSKFITRVTTGAEKPWEYTDKAGKKHSGNAITPTGEFVVVELEDADYYSSTFGPEDGKMPFAVKLRANKKGSSYTGIALHDGAQPGYPASHGCVRLPFGASERLQGLGLQPGDLVVITGSSADYRKKYL